MLSATHPDFDTERPIKVFSFSYQRELTAQGPHLVDSGAIRRHRYRTKTCKHIGVHKHTKAYVHSWAHLWGLHTDTLWARL